MRNLGDMTDLYNVQDTIILREIIDNRFELIYKAYGFNHKQFFKCLHLKRSFKNYTCLAN